MSGNDDIKYDPPVTLKVGQIQFVEACHPPLVAGEYHAGMRQLIKESKDAPVPWNSDPYASDVTFSVDAPRFTLDPAAIHSVYPPANERGRFDNALPHVVFTRRTLPWERTLDGKPPEWGKAFPPWMGILLLEEGELIIRDGAGQDTGRLYEARSLPVVSDQEDSLLFPRPGATILAPDVGQSVPTATWTSERWQYTKASCLAIDLPADLFKAIAPRVRDLPYVATSGRSTPAPRKSSASMTRGGSRSRSAIACRGPTRRIAPSSCRSRDSRTGCVTTGRRRRANSCDSRCWGRGRLRVPRRMISRRG